MIRCRSYVETLKIINDQSLGQNWNVCVIPIGAQGAGKTSLGKYLGSRLNSFIRICPDEIRMEFYCRGHDEKSCDYTDLIGFMNSKVEERVKKKAFEIFRTNECRFIYI